MQKFRKIKEIPAVVGAEIRGVYEVTSMERCIEQEEGRIGFIQLTDETGIINALWCEKEGQVDEGDMVCVQGEIFEYNQEEIVLSVKIIHRLEDQFGIKNLEVLSELKTEISSIRELSNRIQEKDQKMENLVLSLMMEVANQNIIQAENYRSYKEIS